MLCGINEQWKYYIYMCGVHDVYLQQNDSLNHGLGIN